MRAACRWLTKRIMMAMSFPRSHPLEGHKAASCALSPAQLATVLEAQAAADVQAPGMVATVLQAVEPDIKSRTVGLQWWRNCGELCRGPGGAWCAASSVLCDGEGAWCAASSVLRNGKGIWVVGRLTWARNMACTPPGMPKLCGGDKDPMCS